MDTACVSALMDLKRGVLGLMAVQRKTIQNARAVTVGSPKIL
jgi:hypothetical protein